MKQALDFVRLFVYLFKFIKTRSPVKGRGLNLMFSQRNNPYCEANIGLFLLLDKKTTRYEKDSGIGFRNQ